MASSSEVFLRGYRSGDRGLLGRMQPVSWASVAQATERAGGDDQTASGPANHDDSASGEVRLDASLPVCLLVAERDGEPVGVVRLRRRSAGVVEIRALRTRPEALTQAETARLVDAVAARLRELGYLKLVLHSRDAMEDGRHWGDRRGLMMTRRRARRGGYAYEFYVNLYQQPRSAGESAA